LAPPARRGYKISLALPEASAAPYKIYYVNFIRGCACLRQRKRNFIGKFYSPVLGKAKPLTPLLSLRERGKGLEAKEGGLGEGFALRSKGFEYAKEGKNERQLNIIYL